MTTSYPKTRCSDRAAHANAIGRLLGVALAIPVVAVMLNAAAVTEADGQGSVMLGNVVLGSDRPAAESLAIAGDTDAIAPPHATHTRQ